MPTATTVFERLVLVCATEEIAEIARCLNLSYNTIKNYSLGRQPNPEVLIQIVQQLEKRDHKILSLNWLLMGIGDKWLTRSTKPTGDTLRASVPVEGEIEVEIPSHKVIIHLRMPNSVDQQQEQLDSHQEKIPLLEMVDELSDPNSDISPQVKRMARLRLLDSLKESNAEEINSKKEEPTDEGS